MFDRNESKDAELTPELAALEVQLAGLDITPLRASRDELMFAAGRAAERRDRDAATLRIAGAPRWFWPTAAAMMTAACLMLSAMLVWRGDRDMVADGGAKPQAAAVVLQGPTPDEMRDVERFAARGGDLVWATRPKGGYLEKRYIALSRGGELSSLGDSDDSLQSSDSKRPATVRELLHEFVPPDQLPSHSSS